MLDVGVVLPCSLPFQDAVADLAVAQAAGVDSFWLTDHLLGIAHPELATSTSCADRWLDPLCTAAALAGSTTRALGVAVTDGIRRRPADLARSALTLSHLSSGGFNLGVGAGEAMNLTPFGYPFERPVHELAGFLADLRSLLDGQPLQGRPLSRSGLVGPDVRSPRLWVAGHGPRMLELTGKFGDGWLPAWPMVPAEYDDKRQTTANWATAAGRVPPEAGLFVNVLLGSSRDAVLAALDAQPLTKLRALGAPGWLWAKHGLEHPGGPASRGFVDVIVHAMDPVALRRLAPRIPAELLADLWFVGSVTEVSARVREYQHAGCAHIVLADAGDILPEPGPEQFVDLLNVLTGAG